MKRQSNNSQQKNAENSVKRCVKLLIISHDFFLDFAIVVPFYTFVVCFDFFSYSN